MKLQSEFTVTGWTETALPDHESGWKMTRVSAGYEAKGGLTGAFRVEFIISYLEVDAGDMHNSKALYTGFLLFCGSVKGKTGTFLLEDSGVFEDSVPSGVLSIRTGTGTGDFLNIAGGGTYYAKDGKMVMELDCDII